MGELVQLGNLQNAELEIVSIVSFLANKRSPDFLQ